MAKETFEKLLALVRRKTGDVAYMNSLVVRMEKRGLVKISMETNGDELIEPVDEEQVRNFVLIEQVLGDLEELRLVVFIYGDGGKWEFVDEEKTREYLVSEGIEDATEYMKGLREHMSS